MLKNLMFIVAALGTALRLGDLIYLVLQDTIHLPVVVIVLTLVLILCGLFIIAKKLMGTLMLRELMAYFLLITLMLGFNILYIALTLPLKLTFGESIAVGSLLEIAIALVFLYYSAKQVRSHYIAVDHQLEEETDD